MCQTFGPRTSGLKGEWLDPPLLSNFVDVYLFNSNWLMIVLDSPIKQFPTGWGRNGWKKQPRFMFIDLSRWRWWQGLKYMKGVKSNKCALVGVCLSTRSSPGESLFMTDSRKSAGVMKYRPSTSMEANWSNFVFRRVCVGPGPLSGDFAATTLTDECPFFALHNRQQPTPPIPTSVTRNKDVLPPSEENIAQ